MKTLAEIEAAVESLPQDQQEELLRFIEATLRNRAMVSSQQAALGRSKRNFPVSKGRISFTAVDVTQIEHESHATS